MGFAQQKIVNIKASINKSLSNELKAAFPNTIPVQKPLVQDQQILDPNWVAGFTTAEGCFYINIYKSTTKLGRSVTLGFIITQHSRDEQLMRSLVPNLGASPNPPIGGVRESLY